MTHHALAHPAIVPAPARHRPRAYTVRFVLDRYLLFPIGAVIALVWANIDGDTYFRFAHTLAFPVNEIGMALFIALITQEAIEAVMPGGALHTWRWWGMPIVAAIGGTIGAALTFLAWVYLAHEAVLASAWPIACAIDVAVAYYVLKLIAPGSSAIAFLLLMAITTDALVLIALVVPWTPWTTGHWVGVVTVLGAMVAAALMRRSRVRSFWPYMFVCGTASWIGFSLAEVHPALALVPIVPFMPHRPRRDDVFGAAPDDEPVHHAEHEWHETVQVVLFLFGLVNAGVPLRGYDTGTWAVLAAALAGRPVGILLASRFAVIAGLRWPRAMQWRELVVVAWATSVGLAVALFFATGLLPVGAVLQQIKFGALATAAGALVALICAWRLRVGGFVRS